MELNKEISSQDSDIIWMTIRSLRDNKLAASDLLVLKSIESNQNVPQKLLDYRQALRDIPSKFSHPNEVVWPLLN